MADITRTKADVRPLAGSIVRRGEAGDTIEAGEAVYLDGTNGWKPADGSTTGTADARGIMVAPQDAVDGDMIDICYFGPVTGYSSLTPDAPLYVSDTAGEMSEDASDATKDKIIGWAESAQTIFVNCSPDGDPA